MATSAMNRARLDQDRDHALFYDRLAERLGVVASALREACTVNDASAETTTALEIDDDAVLPFVTRVDLLALAGRLSQPESAT